MKTILTTVFGLFAVFSFFESFAQTFSSNGQIIHVSAGGILHINGGAVISNNSQLTNSGTIRTTINSTLGIPGDFQLLSNSTAQGNGTYEVEQNWVNDASFTANNSTVLLYGNNEQLITSNNSTSTAFNNLTLTGNGTGVNRRKTLSGVNASTGINGTLNLNNRELNTNTNTFIVLNPAVNSVTHNTTFGAEGFVSSIEPGSLQRNTNSASEYLFPVGSSDGTLRYRPVIMRISDGSANTFSARLNNYSPNADSYLLSQKEADIEEANNLFYHSLDQISGNSDASVRTHYLSSADGNWSGIANWSNAINLWQNTGETSTGDLANYSFVERPLWNFNSKYHPYLLINLGDELVIPNVFTPNGDGVNDLYFVTTKGLTEFNLTILNRWGNVVFETNDTQSGWDGTADGRKCADGTYFYIINAKSNTKEYKKHGHITLNGN